MKTLILIVLMTLSTGSVFGQEFKPNDVTETLVNLFVKDINGYIDGTFTFEDGRTMQIVKVPGFYDFDLLRVKFSNFINGFYDLEMHLSWRRDDTDKNIMWGTLLFNKELIIIVTYNLNTKLFSVWPTTNN